MRSTGTQKPVKAAIDNKKTIKTTPANTKTHGLSVDDRRYKVMEFHNNYLLGLSEGFPERYLTEIQKRWYKEIVENYQGSVKVYVNENYKDNYTPAFNRPGNYDVADFFAAYTEKPAKVLPGKARDRLKKAGCFAPESNEANAEHLRQFTKYRVIVSKVPYLDGNGNLQERKMISTCAPNFMGSSPEDRKRFLIAMENKSSQGKTQYRLNTKEYEKCCNELAMLIAYAAKENGMSPLDIAQFGLGVYLNAFNDNDMPEEQKDIAREIMYKAFIAAAKANDIKINWLIYEKTPNAQQIVDTLSETYKNDKDYIRFKIGNILESTNSLNNGSDRTIGGKFTHPDAGTTEEQVSQEFFLMQVQTDCNPLINQNVIVVNTNNINASKMKMDDIANIQPSGVQPDTQQKIHFEIRLGEGTQKKDRFVQLIFNDKQLAQNVAHNLLKEHKIQNFKNPGQPVNIKPIEGNKFVIRLNNVDFNKLCKDDTAYNKLLLNNFIRENKLDFSLLENRIFWCNQVSMGGDEIKLPDRMGVLTVPSSIKFIHETLNRNDIDEQMKITAIREKFSSFTSSRLFSPGRSDETQKIIDDAEKLKDQFITVASMKQIKNTS